MKLVSIERRHASSSCPVVAGELVRLCPTTLVSAYTESFDSKWWYDQICSHEKLVKLC